MLVATGVLATVVTASPAAAKQRRPNNSPEWDGRVERIAHQVEDLRGLEFDRPIKVWFLPDNAFDAAAGGAFPPDFERELRREERAQRVLGLIERADDVVASLEEAGSSGLLGYYDGTVTVRGSSSSIATQFVLAHELTHALHDQHFGTLDAAALDDELAWAGIAALEEGDADRVAGLWLDRQSRARQDRFERAYERLAGNPGAEPSEIPEIVRSEIGAPYSFGVIFADAIVATGGNRALNRAFRNPPDDDAGVLNPRRVGRFEGRFVPDPGLADGEHQVGPYSNMGALGLFHLLASRLDPMVALDAADEWTGDRGVLFRRDGRDCVRATFEGRSVASTAAIAAALDLWSQATGTATAALTDESVTIDACGAPAEPPASILSADLFALERNRVVVGSLDHDADPEGVECAVGAYFDDGELSAALLEEDPEDKPSKQIRELFDRRRDIATTRCGFDPGPQFDR